MFPTKLVCTSKVPITEDGPQARGGWEVLFWTLPSAIQNVLGPRRDGRPWQLMDGSPLQLEVECEGFLNVEVEPTELRLHGYEMMLQHEVGGEPGARRVLWYLFYTGDIPIRATQIGYQGECGLGHAMDAIGTLRGKTAAQIEALFWNGWKEGLEAWAGEPDDNIELLKSLGPQTANAIVPRARRTEELAKLIASAELNGATTNALLLTLATGANRLLQFGDSYRRALEMQVAEFVLRALEQGVEIPLEYVIPFLDLGQSSSPSVDLGSNRWYLALILDNKMVDKLFKKLS